MGASRAESLGHALIQPLEQGCDLSSATRLVLGIQTAGQTTLSALASSEVVIKAEASSDFEDKTTLVRTYADWAWCALLQPRRSD